MNVKITHIHKIFTVMLVYINCILCDVHMRGEKNGNNSIKTNICSAILIVIHIVVVIWYCDVCALLSIFLFFP